MTWDRIIGLIILTIEYGLPLWILLFFWIRAKVKKQASNHRKYNQRIG